MLKSKKVSLIVAIAMIISLLLPQVNGIAATTPDGYRKLLDLQVFKDKSVTGWSGSGAGELETVNSTLPVDSTVTYNGLPSLRLNIQTQMTSAWWISLLTLRGWNAANLTQYVPNGYLEFNLKGKDGGEQFVIGARDKVPERSLGLEIDGTQPITQYCTVTTDWQHVKIPLKDFMNTLGFDPSSVTCILLNRVNNNPFTVWFNDMKITSPDNEKSAPAIKVNQVGFLPNAEKYALVTGFAEDLQAKEGTAFQVRKASDDSVAYEGTLALVTDYESVDSGEKILKADFSDLQTSGDYYITVSATDIDKSPKFTVGKDVYKPLISDASRYFYYQRQGIELEAPYAPDYPRADKTPQDTAATFASGKKAPMDVTKGWYDAGDFGKYINAGATGVSDLFWTYEMFPSQCIDNQFNIPESGNNVPDILDEARWELEWMLKMQDSASGGFYPRVQSDNDEKVTSRIIKDQNGCTTDDTACAAGVLAQAYLLYKDFDSTFANQCLDAAKKAWSFLESNPTNIVSPSGPYNVSNDSSDRLWASASLYRATGDLAYHTYFKANYTKFAGKFEDSKGNAHTWGDMWFTAFLCYLKADNKDTQVVNWISTEFDKWLNTILTRYENNPWKNTIAPGNYYWGINMQIMNTPMDAIIGAQLLGKSNDSITKMGLGSLNWLLGTNPLRFSFVSGYGEDSVKTVFSNIYNFDSKQGVPKGYLPGGPNASEGAGISRFAAKCYLRSSVDWVSNEHTVYWNSPLVFMSAFANKDGSSEPMPTLSPIPTPTASASPAPSSININVNIDTKSERKSISPYVYGTNQYLDNAKVNARRQGGNRMTGYNWENNYSNAGRDWQQSSDTYLLNDVPKDRWNEPAAVTSVFHETNLAKGIPYSLITLQAAGYVAADANGTVLESEKAPSERWKSVEFSKGTQFTLNPDTSDSTVYMDEYVNYLVKKFGSSSSSTGIKGYSIDNEAGLWCETHPRLHPAQVTCAELLDKSIALSKAVKWVDPNAEVFGPAAYGFSEFMSLQSAYDWGMVQGDYRWFLDYYLDKMKTASDDQGKRLLDVLDLHWYPEAQGGGHRICFGEDITNIETNKARLQAPRTLWDKTYYEDSWIGTWNRAFLPLLPNVQASIDKYYPGTKLAFTEYDYGGGKHITGGIAQADVLGIFGKNGVYFSSYWGDSTNSYIASAFNLYTNYDGNGAAYGNTNVKCDTADVENSSVYASIVGEDEGKLHIIVMNKNYDSPATFNFNINSGKNYTSGKVWAFDKDSANIVQRQGISNIGGNKFSYTIPALTACHIVLDASEISAPTEEFKVETVFKPATLAPNQMQTVRVTATNTSSEPYTGVKNVLLIVALYDSKNTMTNISFISKGIPYLGTENLSAGFKLPSDINGYTVRAFMWDGTSLSNTEMTPISNVEILK